MTLHRLGLANPRVCQPDGTASQAIGVERAVVTFDRTWSPYVQAELELLVADAWALAALDPRKGLRTRFTLTQDDLAGGVYSADFDLAFRRRGVQWLAGSGSVAAASDEALWQDWADSATTVWGQASVQQAINAAAVSQGYLLGHGYLPHLDAPDRAMPSAATRDDAEDYWEPGTSAWAYCSQLAETAGAWLFSDERGTIHYSAPGWRANGSTLTLDGATNVIDVQDDVDRDDEAWGNGAVVAYQAPGSSSIGYASSFDLAHGPRKVLRRDRARKKPSTGTPADTMRSNAQRRGRRLTLTAVADFRARPNQPAVASYRGQRFAGTVESVAFTVPEGTMQLVLAVVE